MVKDNPGAKDRIKPQLESQVTLTIDHVYEKLRKRNCVFSLHVCDLQEPSLSWSPKQPFVHVQRQHLWHKFKLPDLNNKVNGVPTTVGLLKGFLWYSCLCKKIARHSI